MPHIHATGTIISKLGIINTQFYRFFRLCSSKVFFVSQIVSFIVLLKNIGYSLKIV
jgi:hypothetical protein